MRETWTALAYAHSPKIYPQSVFQLQQKVPICGVLVQIILVVAWLETNTRNLGQTRLETEGDVEVECTTLQTVLVQGQLTHIDALKIDIEGHEDKASNP